MKDEELEGDVWGSARINPQPFSCSSHLIACSTPETMPGKGVAPSKECKKRSSAPVNIPHNREMRTLCGAGSSDDDVVPPHEYIARRLATTQISSFSVSQGIGRKLKGRDLSQVRNHVLRKTGFLET